MIGWNLGGIDVDERNVMTGTRDFNIKGMKKFEDEVYNYLKENQTSLKLAFSLSFQTGIYFFT